MSEMKLKLKKSFLISLWFVFLTFPILVIRVNTIEKMVEWRWKNMLYTGLASFVLSLIWLHFFEKRELVQQREETSDAVAETFSRRIFEDPNISRLV